MAQAPEAFNRVKSDIEHYTGTGSPFDAVLAGWTASDRVTFARWYLNEENAQRTESIQKQKTRPAMNPAMYIQHLRSVDFSHTASITTFIYEAQIRDWDPYPEPIVLGFQDGIEYQLRSELVDLEPSYDLPAGVLSSDRLVEIRTTNPNTECPLRFVFPLGILRYTRSADSSRVETPFHVCVNPIDLSIWLVLAEYTLNDLGDREEIPRSTDPWPYLGLRSDGREKFDVMELMTWEQFQGLVDQGLRQELFGRAKAAIQVWPTAWVPTKEAVEAVVPRHRAGQVPARETSP